MRAAATAFALSVAACGARTPLPEDGVVADVDAGDARDASVDGGAPDATRDASPRCVPAGPDAGICSALAAFGPPVTVVCDPSPPPTPRGGAIADGTYVLVSSRFYGACASAEADRITWSVCGSAWSTIQESTRFGATTVQHIDGDATTHGTSLDFRVTCGPVNIPTVTFDYDATPTSLTLYVHGFGPGTLRVDAFERR